MASVPITISFPVLVTGQYFKVRYRELPGGSFVAIANQTNAPFTISGIDEGNYELEVILFNGNIDCPPTYRYFAGTEPVDCFLFGGEIVQSDQIFEAVISIAFPSPVIYPPCGYRIVWTQGGVSHTIDYATFSDDEIRITLPDNQPTIVQVYANDCTGFRECTTLELAAIDPLCSGIVITNVTKRRKPANPNYWEITITYNQSTPKTRSATWTWQQTNPVIPPRAPDSGSVFHPSMPLGTSNGFTITVFPSPGTNTETPTYKGTLIDYCGNTVTWTV